MDIHVYTVMLSKERKHCPTGSLALSLFTDYTEWMERLALQLSNLNPVSISHTASESEASIIVVLNSTSKNLKEVVDASLKKV